MGGVDFGNMYFVLKEGAKAIPDGATLEIAKASGAVLISYGVFINFVINFLIVGFAVFMMVRVISKMQKAPAPADRAPPTSLDAPCRTRARVTPRWPGHLVPTPRCCRHRRRYR